MICFEEDSIVFFVQCAFRWFRKLYKPLTPNVQCRRLCAFPVQDREKNGSKKKKFQWAREISKCIPA